MDSLEPNIFIVPVAALVLLVTGYVYFLRKVSDQTTYKKLVIHILILAFLFNLVWEVLQGPLYEGFQYNIKHISICALASVADAMWVMLLYYIFALIYRDFFWIQKLKKKRIVLVILVGGMGAILSEMSHVSADHWAYAESMPIIPVIEVGLSPFLQFLVLPILIYLISKYFLKAYG
ncbi:hypothetical protein OKW21_004444 [Catalinimonas alkaloidigena]|nr:hypothetical protein [Catalinimonas alkaloidigena]